MGREREGRRSCEIDRVVENTRDTVSVFHVGRESMNEDIEKLHSLLSYLGRSMDPKTITSPMFDIEARSSNVFPAR